VAKEKGGLNSPGKRRALTHRSAALPLGTRKKSRLDAEGEKENRKVHAVLLEITVGERRSYCNGRGNFCARGKGTTTGSKREPVLSKGKKRGQGRPRTGTKKRSPEYKERKSPSLSRDGCPGA